MKQSNGCRKVFIGCGGLSAIATLILTMVFALNWYETKRWGTFFIDTFVGRTYLEELSTSEEVLDYLQSHPDTFSLVAYSVAPDGTAIDTDSQIWHNPDILMPLASTKKILVLATYAQAIVAGQLDPQSEVAVGDWDHYYLPDTDGAAHIEALAYLDIETDDNGYALDTNVTVTLDDMAFAMMRYSDNAATDYFLDLLGAEAVEKVMVDAGLTPEPILPIAGTMLMWQNHEQPRLNTQIVADLTALERDVYITKVWDMQDKFLNQSWGTEERMWRRSEEQQPLLHRLEMIVANQLGSMGTARIFAQIMAHVVTDKFISADVSAIMRQHLEWPMELPGIQDNFMTMGAKGGSLRGVVTGATYYIPRNGDFKEQPRVVVLFIHEMPFTVYWRLGEETFAHQQLELDIAINADFVKQVKAALD